MTNATYIIGVLFFKPNIANENSFLLMILIRLIIDKVVAAM